MPHSHYRMLTTRVGSLPRSERSPSKDCKTNAMMARAVIREPGNPELRPELSGSRCRLGPG